MNEIIREMNNNTWAEGITWYWYNDAEIFEYIDSDEPYDKAGSYGIQAKGALLVKEIRGDYFNIVGLPIAELSRKLNDFI